MKKLAILAALVLTGSAATVVLAQTPGPGTKHAGTTGTHVHRRARPVGTTHHVSHSRVGDVPAPDAGSAPPLPKAGASGAAGGGSGGHTGPVSGSVPGSIGSGMGNGTGTGGGRDSGGGSR